MKSLIVLVFTITLVVSQLAIGQEHIFKEKYVTKNTAACLYLTDFEILRAIVVANDVVAWKDFMSQPSVNGCWELKDGIPVQVFQVAHGYIFYRFRIIGTQIVLWTTYKSLKVVQ